MLTWFNLFDVDIRCRLTWTSVFLVLEGARSGGGHEMERWGNARGGKGGLGDGGKTWGSYNVS